MFSFLGAGFMLLETKAGGAGWLCYFGSTLGGELGSISSPSLVLILMANLYVLKLSRVSLWPGIIADSCFSWVLVCWFPTDLFLSGGIVLALRLFSLYDRASARSSFAAVIFRRSNFVKRQNPDRALGLNIAGGRTGAALAESCSGGCSDFQYLLFVAIGFLPLLGVVPAACKRAPA